MLRLKILSLGILLSFAGIGGVVADESTDSKPTTQTEKKSNRKPKDTICKECGKPESQCECKHEDKGHKEGDGHKH